MTRLRQSFDPYQVAAFAPRPADEQPRLTGRKVVLIVANGSADGRHYAPGYRAASEVRQDREGRPSVRVVTEGVWSAWPHDAASVSGDLPHSTSWPVDRVLVID